MRQIFKSSTAIISVITALALVFGAARATDAARVRIEWEATNRDQVSYFQLMRKKDDGPWQPRGELLSPHYYYTYDTQTEPGTYAYSVHALQRDGNLVEPERQPGAQAPAVEVTCQGSECVARPPTADILRLACGSSDWQVGAWGACSAACGGGTQTRVVTALTQCAGFGGQPQSVRQCNLQACAPSALATPNAAPVVQLPGQPTVNVVPQAPLPPLPPIVTVEPSSEPVAVSGVPQASETLPNPPQPATDAAAERGTRSAESLSDAAPERDTTPPAVNTFDFVIDRQLYHYNQNGPLVYAVAPTDNVDIGVIWAAHDGRNIAGNPVDVSGARLFFMTEAEFSPCRAESVDIRDCQQLAHDTNTYESSALLDTSQGRSALMRVPFGETRYVSLLVRDASGNTTTDREAGAGPMRVETQSTFTLSGLEIVPRPDTTALAVRWNVTGAPAQVTSFEIFRKGPGAESPWRAIATVPATEQRQEYESIQAPPADSGLYFYGLHAVFNYQLSAGKNWLDEREMSGGAVAPAEIDYVKPLPQVPVSSQNTTLQATIAYVNQGQRAQRSFAEGGIIITNRSSIDIAWEMQSVYSIDGIELYTVPAAGEAGSPCLASHGFGEQCAKTLLQSISGQTSSVRSRGGQAALYTMRHDGYTINMRGKSGVYIFSVVPYSINANHNASLQVESNWQGPIKALVGMPEQLTLGNEVSAERASFTWDFTGVSAATWNAIDHIEVWRAPVSGERAWAPAPNGTRNTPSGTYDIADGGSYIYGVHVVANGTYATESDYGVDTVAIDAGGVADSESPLLLTRFGLQGIDGNTVYYNGGTGIFELTTNMNFLVNIEAAQRTGTSIAGATLYRCTAADASSGSCITNGRQIASLYASDFTREGDGRYISRYLTRWSVADFGVGEHYIGVAVRDSDGNQVTHAQAGRQRRKVAYGPIQVLINPSSQTDAQISNFRINNKAVGETAVVARAGQSVHLSWAISSRDTIRRMSVAGLGDVSIARNIIANPAGGTHTLNAPAPGVYRVKLQLWTEAGVGIETPEITLIVQPPKVTRFTAEPFIGDTRYVQLAWAVDAPELTDHIDLWRRLKDAPESAWQQIPYSGYQPSVISSGYADHTVATFGYFEYGIHVTMKDAGGYFTTESALNHRPVVASMYRETPFITSVAVNGVMFGSGLTASLPAGNRVALDWDIELGDPARRADQIRRLSIYFFPGTFMARYGCQVADCPAATSLAMVNVAMADYEVRDNHISGTIFFDVPQLLEAGTGYVGLSVNYREDSSNVYDRDQGKGPVQVNVE